MDTYSNTAVLNNIIWCGIVSETHGITHNSRGNVWGLASEAPPFYPDIITSNKNVTTQEVVEFIGDRNILSIKDSFANLAMEPFGFKILFDAEWIYHAPVLESAVSAWRVVTTEEDLARWTAAYGIEKIIKPQLIGRDDVKIFIHENRDKLSGFIANAGAGAVGISNVFATDYHNQNLWKDIVQAVATEFPKLPMVGYEQKGDLAAILSCGWESLGPLRIWIQSDESR
ncbi:hypothetical protein [Bacillus sp. 165]|uniref:hypothetical protein n=1 Tax=Bacillus sp. 165 TaxID=1529117 RepID=UPI001AD994E1|nr:hypothetical protein [Bacillus sp. 165]MBO9129404.1 hypothetical protein [Bacillus sp. 165]